MHRAYCTVKRISGNGSAYLCNPHASPSKHVSNGYARPFADLAETPVPRGFPGGVRHHEERKATPLKSTRIPDA
jgi:hypothetical protein